MIKKLIPYLIKDLLKKILQLWKSPFFGLIWFVLLFFISFLIVFQFLFFLFFLLWYLIIFLFKYFISALKKDSEQLIVYKYNNFKISNNFVLFLKFIFFDLSKKWSFFYFYQFLYVFKSFFNLDGKKSNFYKNFNIKIFIKQICNFLKNYIIKYFLYLLTTFTYTVLNLSLEITIKIQQFWNLNWSNYLIFFDNLFFDIVSTYNENINLLILNKKIIIKKNFFFLNPKDKFIKIDKNQINRSINNFIDVWRYSCDIKNVPYIDIKNPNILLSSTAKLSRTMINFSGSLGDREKQIFMGLKYGDKKTITSTFIDMTRFNLNDNDSNVNFSYSKNLYKKNLEFMDCKNKFIYKFNEITNSEKNQNILSPCIEINNKDIKLTNINNGIKGLLSPQDENETPERIMLAKNIVLNFNEPLYKIKIQNEQGEWKHFIQVDDIDDTLKNRFINNKKMFSIVTEPIFEELTDFVEINSVMYEDPEMYDLFKRAFNFYVAKESKIGSIMNILDLSLKSDSDGSNINLDNFL